MRKRRSLLGGMGRANRSSQPARPVFRVHYRKLHDDYERQQLKFMPSLPDYVSYCCCRCGHTQQVNAEELNSIVSNALRMAYVAQLQRRPIFQDVIASKSSPHFRRDKHEHPNTWNKQSVGDNTNIANSVRSASSNCCFKSQRTGLSAADMSLQLSSASSPSLRLSSVKTPNSIPGLVPSENALGADKNEEKSASEQSTPSSDESNSPTELNCYKKFSEKPALIKRLAMGFGRDVLGLACEDDVCPLVSQRSSPSSPNRPHSGGYINEAIIDSDPPRPPYTKLSESLDNNINALTANDLNLQNNRITNCETENDLKSHNLADGSTHGSTPTPPPPLPERTDSLSSRTEETELRQAPWFQAGIPREITLEVLSQEPEGAFMVRESTSKPGCYALSLRVPREFQPSGIAHYLIMRTIKGFKIKGFTKEFTSLTALITHHSVMPELLPCPLSLSRYNPSFVKSDLNKDFADIDSDSDYNTLTDFRKMMADLNV